VAAPRGRAAGSGGRGAREARRLRRRFSDRPRPAVPAARRASFHTSPPPAPSVRSLEYPRRPDRTCSCSFHAAPSLARRRPPHRSPVPTTGRGWRERPEAGRAEKRVRGLGGELLPPPEPGAMRTSPHLARALVRRSDSRSQGSRTRWRRRRGPEAWDAGRGSASLDREKTGLRRAGVGAGGLGPGAARSVGQKLGPRSRGRRGALGRPAGPVLRETTKWADGRRVAILG
jgi:hypothetical protein